MSSRREKGIIRGTEGNQVVRVLRESDRYELMVLSVIHYCSAYRSSTNARGLVSVLADNERKLVKLSSTGQKM